MKPSLFKAISSPSNQLQLIACLAAISESCRSSDFLSQIA
jgi:hypothetical protein